MLVKYLWELAKQSEALTLTEKFNARPLLIGLAYSWLLRYFVPRIVSGREGGVIASVWTVAFVAKKVAGCVERVSALGWQGASTRGRGQLGTPHRWRIALGKCNELYHWPLDERIVKTKWGKNYVQEYRNKYQKNLEQTQEFGNLRAKWSWTCRNDIEKQGVRRFI